MRRAKGCCVGHHTTDKLGVANCNHGRCIAAVTFAKEVGLRDSKIFQQANHIVGVLLDRKRALRDIGRATMPLMIDGNDPVALNQRGIRVYAGVSEGSRDANQRIARALNFVIHL